MLRVCSCGGYGIRYQKAEETMRIDIVHILYAVLVSVRRMEWEVGKDAFGGWVCTVPKTLFL